MADIFYTDATLVDDKPFSWPTAAPARAHRRRRTWHKFVLIYSMMCAGIALLLRELVLRTGGNEAGGVFIVALVAVVALLAALVILFIFWRLDRL